MLVFDSLSSYNIKQLGVDPNVADPDPQYFKL